MANQFVGQELVAGGQEEAEDLDPPGATFFSLSESRGGHSQ